MMSNEVAIITAAAIGGALGFLSSYFTLKLQLKNVQKATFFEKRFDVLQFISLILFRLHRGDNISDIEWNKFISGSYLLPTTLRNLCWKIVTAKDSAKLISEAEREIIAFIDQLEK